MLFFVWGLRTYTKTLATLSLACRNGHVASHRVVKVTRKFTLFWIPLFPVKTRYLSICAGCGLQQTWDKQSAETAAAQGGQGPVTTSGVPSASDGRFMGAVHNPVHPPVNSSAAPPGWYPDPGGGPGLRYWDGASWTASVHDG